MDTLSTPPCRTTQTSPFFLCASQLLPSCSLHSSRMQAQNSLCLRLTRQPTWTPPLSQRVPHPRAPPTVSLSPCRPTCIWHTPLLPRVRKPRDPEDNFHPICCCRERLPQTSPAAHRSRIAAESSALLSMPLADQRLDELGAASSARDHCLCGTLGRITWPFAFPETSSRVLLGVAATSSAAALGSPRGSYIPKEKTCAGGDL